MWIFLTNFFKKSDGGKNFLLLLKHAFKTQTLNVVVWKKLIAVLQ